MKPAQHTLFARAAGIVLVGLGMAFLLALSTSSNEKTTETADFHRIPRPDHVVIVILENKSYDQIIDNPAAPYVNRLAGEGALFTQSYAVTHPSQPNYLALFSGSTQGVTQNGCPISVRGSNLARELRKKRLTFGIYSESMPGAGYMGCEDGLYVRKHNPAANWQGMSVPPHANMPFNMFPSDYSKLPTVSMVVPNRINDMHDGETPQAIGRGDQWLKDHLDSYVKWAATHNSLLIVTWDEDDEANNTNRVAAFFAGNHIATIFVGPMVKPGRYDTSIDHYSVLRTVLDMYGLKRIGQTADAAPIVDVWQAPEPARQAAMIDPQNNRLKGER
jgi:hypothetical protein